ncbi:MAG TPA: glycosyl hydrolase family 28 protein [Acidobacteriaceae bacterium]|jgi:polygalacturonase|nr:glycosyl hydrolase family 28 protein [Acidobacteriaceae bacterium]
MKHALLAATLVLSTLSAHASTTLIANDFGAKGDGATIDTAAIQRALDAAASHHDTVTLRPGTYLIGSIFIKGETHLLLPKGVTLRGIRNLAAYPEMPTRVAGIEMTWPAALVNVYKQKDVQITGEGTIDGDGSFWWKSYWNLRREYDPRGLRWAADYDAKRPRLIQIYDSSNVTLDGPMLERSGFWTVHICYSHDITVDHITIRNNIGGRGPSTDGVDIDSSRHVLVQHADIDVNDDALCLKSGRDADGLRVNRPTEDVILRDSIIRSGAAAVTFGSETSGGFRNIEAYNLTAGKGVGAGVLIKSAKVRGGGGRDLRIHDLHLDGVATPIAVNLNWNPNYSYATLPPDVKNPPSYWITLTTPVPPDKGLPHFSDVHIWNIDATNARTAIRIAAYPNAKLENFRIDHVRISAANAGSIADTDGLALSDIDLTVPTGSRLESTDNTNLHGLDTVHYEQPHP